MESSLVYVKMTGPDRHLDTTGDFDAPINSLPTKCAHCTFRDIDHVPQPYLLGRGIDRPAAISPANLANFLVREWPRRVIELTCPGQCEFYSTLHVKTKQTTPWSLAVPVHRIPIGRVKAEVPLCPVCGEPKTCHIQEFDFDSPTTIAWDIATTAGWFGTEHIIGLDEARKFYRTKFGPRFESMAADPGWERRGIYRRLFFSLRLELLLKTLKIKGMVRAIGQPATRTKEDKHWVNQQIELLRKLGLEQPRKESATPESSPEGTEAKLAWFEHYLKKHGKRKKRIYDFGPIEDVLGKPLPASYKAFVEKLGTIKFKNVDEQEGFDVEILLPESLDLKSFRRGVIELGDEESREVDGVMFAATGHGDTFCFDLASDGPEYIVYLYDHELNGFESYASNFMEFVQRVSN